MKRIAIVINPESGRFADKITNNDLIELNKYLSEGWSIERETILPCSTAMANGIGYKGLSSVIYVLVSSN